MLSRLKQRDLFAFYSPWGPSMSYRERGWEMQPYWTDCVMGQLLSSWLIQTPRRIIFQASFCLGGPFSPLVTIYMVTMYGQFSEFPDLLVFLCVLFPFDEIVTRGTLTVSCVILLLWSIPLRVNTFVFLFSYCFIACCLSKPQRAKGMLSLHAPELFPLPQEQHKRRLGVPHPCRLLASSVWFWPL